MKSPGPYRTPSDPRSGPRLPTRAEVADDVDCYLFWLSVHGYKDCLVKYLEFQIKWLCSESPW